MNETIWRSEPEPNQKENEIFFYLSSIYTASIL